MNELKRVLVQDLARDIHEPLNRLMEHAGRLYLTARGSLHCDIPATQEAILSAAKDLAVKARSHAPLVSPLNISGLGDELAPAARLAQEAVMLDLGHADEQDVLNAAITYGYEVEQVFDRRLGQK